MCINKNSKFKTINKASKNITVMKIKFSIERIFSYGGINSSKKCAISLCNKYKCAILIKNLKFQLQYSNKRYYLVEKKHFIPFLLNLVCTFFTLLKKITMLKIDAFPTLSKNCQFLPKFPKNVQCGFKRY